MASDQERFLIPDSVTSDDCELLKFAFLSASEGSTLLDKSSLTKPDIQGYAVVFKHLSGNWKFMTYANNRTSVFFKTYNSHNSQRSYFLHFSQEKFIMSLWQLRDPTFRYCFYEGLCYLPKLNLFKRKNYSVKITCFIYKSEVEIT